MNVIIIILALLWSLLTSVASFAWKYKLQIIYIIMALALMFIIYVLIKCVDKYISDKKKRKNELLLYQYLQDNCLECGYMNPWKWRKLLPDFAYKEYFTGFDYITSEFAKEVEAKYVKSAKEKWIHPIIEYLTQNGMADIYELTQVPNEFLKYTHYTSDAILINRELDRLCETAEKDGRKIIEKIRLERESVEMMYHLPGKNINEVYLNAYKISGDFLTSQILQKGNLVTHEFSADDLGIL